MVQPGRAPLAGRYELLGLLATGGMGQVWRARDVLLGRPVAVKVLRSEYTGDPTFVARFRAEAQHAAVLQHEGIAAVHDYGEALADDAGGERLAYLVMELVDGESLSELLAREGRLDVPRTLALLRQTAAALAAAHEAGVVHRDVKPGNVLVSPDGRVTITDFGIAWSASSVPLTQTGQVVGTAHYLSPEQAEGGKASPASDVYALGMVAYECLAGRRAFDGENAVQIALRQIRDVPDPLPDDVPDAVRDLVGRMLLKDPAARFADGAAVRDAVDDVLAGRRAGAGVLGDGGTRPMAVVWPAADALPTSAAPAPRPLGARVLAPVAALLVGAALAVAGVALLAPAAPAPVAAATAEEETAVVLAAAEHVGRPVAEVEADLARLGLRVAQVPSETGRSAPGTVLSLTPTGALSRGDLVTLTVAVAPRPAPEPSPAPAPAPPVAVVANPPAPAPAPAPAPVAVEPVSRGGSAPASGDDSREDDEQDGRGEDDREGEGKAEGKAEGDATGDAKGDAKDGAEGGGKGKGGDDRKKKSEG